MRLVVSTPLAIILETEDVRHVRAEDETGAFGIRTGHADFLTALAISVVTWRNGAGAEHHIAVRGGLLQVRGGRTVTVATREAVCGDDLRQLEVEVLAGFRRRQQEEQAARTDAQRLYLGAIHQIMRYLRPPRGPALAPGASESEQTGRAGR